MKNPFERNNHKLLISGIVIGTVATSAAAYLFLTENGKQVRSRLNGQLAKIRNSFSGKQEIQANIQRDPSAYLKHKTKAPKTDRDALHKHELLHESGSHPENANEE